MKALLGSVVIAVLTWGIYVALKGYQVLANIVWAISTGR